MLGAGDRGLAVGGRLVGAQQPSPLLLGTSQDWAMSWQVGAVVPSGRRQSSLRLLVQVPGEGGAGASLWWGALDHPLLPFHPPDFPGSQSAVKHCFLPGAGGTGSRWESVAGASVAGGRRSRAGAAWGRVPAAVVPGPSLPQQASCGSLLTTLALGVVAEVAVGQLGLEDPPVEDDSHADGGNLDAHLGGPRRRHGQAVLAEALPHPHLAKQDLGT